MPLRRSPTWADPRVKPPFGAARLRDDHPLAQDLIIFWLLNELGGNPGSVADGSDGQTTVSSMTWDLMPAGVAARTSGGGYIRNTKLWNVGLATVALRTLTETISP